MEEETTIPLAVIIGSIRPDRFGPVVANWFLGQLKHRNEFKTDVIDLADLDLPANLDGSGDSGNFSERVSAADAFVFVTPEYNHGVPGSLKNAIDTLRDEWRGKAAGFVSYGGTAGGLRSVELQRLTLVELQVYPVRRAVSLHNAHDLFDDAGELRDPEPANQTLDGMLTQLAWWARALRDARASWGLPIQ